MYPSPGLSKNTAEDDPLACKQRFKGVETFLRRIAFNLGNTPSQTEVKIISCIPIDVTDLQNKIVSLERQLFEAKNSKGSKNTPVHTALIEPTIRSNNAVVNCKCSDVGCLGLGDTSKMATRCGDGSSKTRKSSVSFLFPTLSTGLQQNQPYMQTENWVEKESQDTSIGSRQKGFFRRCKKSKSVKKKENRKTQLVYYAQTENRPFTSYGMSTEIPFLDYTNPKVDNAFSKSYLANVVQRHFDPEQVVEEFSDTSHFTSPVCRDFHTRGYCPYESDVCSCCHGLFHDVDKYIGKNQNFIIEPITTDIQKDVYYDSNLYDIVPVREKATKVPKEEKLPMKESKRPSDIRCWPESARTKPRHHITEAHHEPKLHIKYNNSKKPTCKVQNAKDNIKKKTQKYYRENKLDKITGPTDTSKSCYIDCGEIYCKPLFATRKAEIPKKDPVRTVFRKNAECLTIDVDTKNLTITRSIQIDINSTETKTEETLNQIKSILQSVLAEVKTNTQVNNLPEATLKKDVIIQKEPSQSNVPTCSSLLHSFTYNSSFNAHPYVNVPTCSRQIASPFYYANVPHQHPNYTQNYPLLVQTPRHQKCGYFCKNSNFKSTPAQKQAATTATNTETDGQETKGGETEKLIKEIYKSIALTMDFQKETSNSEYDDLKSVTNNSINASNPKVLRSTIVATSGSPMKNVQIEASLTPISTTTVRSNYNTNVTNEKRKEIDHYLNYESQSTERELVDAEHNTDKANVASTISEHYSEELTTDGESEGLIETVQDVKDKEKKGLLKRMLGSVKLFSKKKQNKIIENKKQDMTQKIEAEKSESDSDDYQTIFSERSIRPEQRFNKNYQYKPRNYSTYRPVQEKIQQQRVRSNRKSPYMEQEYRRQWNEQLMFQENRNRRYSSERAYPYQQSPVYWQNYEARSAMVDHHIPYQTINNLAPTTPIKTVIHKMEQRTSPLSIVNRKDTKSKFSWLRKHKLGISQCGEQWKKFILEN